MHDVLVFLFAIAAGMTASGVLSTIYRMIAREPETRLGTCLHYVVMVIAGPVVLISNSTKSFRKKQCSKAAYALAIALSTYWSFTTGLFFLMVMLALRGA